MALCAVAWVSLRWLERGPTAALATAQPWQHPSLVGAPDP
jgi:hypothetical protein